ncbi:endolytic transglycosylase MltG [Neobacillus notoginsengisoli]|uniref:Endolytic murein transglycosylase n=1 Tax=Neobacillus notoginsengisoli TaxID=1578198 RepID=A0A417YTT8_9BACI|nr:endolytic transglycosylase MltG [Neobacillus notoginsengisoli]RHW40586.1 endolytic transglycosylase MltG [Neobacillus notoginsengisoli]
MSADEKNAKKEIIRQKMIEHQSEARVVRKIVLLITVTIIVLAGVIGGGSYLYVKSALKPVDPESKETREVTIPIGSSVTGIANELEKSGVIKNARIFKYYVKFNNESGFMAGDYKMTPAMTIPEIIKSLKTGKVVQRAKFKMAVPEGKQLSEIAAIVAKATGQTEEDVFAKLNDAEFIKGLMAKYPDLLTKDILDKKVKHPLEGYLYPATYPIYKDNPTVDELVVDMLNKTKSVLAPYNETMAEKKLTPHQLLTMASLIEEEATEKADRHKISSVFYNRIETGMPLQTDPTVLYALGKHKHRVLYKDLEVESPYNTYKYAGLPPGPIANAGKMSIEAALNPDETKYYYFLASKDGEVHFSKTLQEHNRLKAKYITNNK